MPIFEQNHFLHGWKWFLDSRHSPRSLKCLCKNIRGFAGFSIRTVSTMVAEQFNPENFQPRNCPGIVLELPQKSNHPPNHSQNCQKSGFVCFSIKTVSTMVAKQFNPENFQPRNCPGIVPELSWNCPKNHYQNHSQNHHQNHSQNHHQNHSQNCQKSGFACFSIKTVSTMVAEQFNSEHFNPKVVPETCLETCP